VKKQSVIQNALARSLAEATSQEKLLPWILTKAAKRRNINFTELEIQRLATALLNASGNTISLDLDSPCAFGETEREIQATVQELIDELNVSTIHVQEDLEEAMSRVIPRALGAVAKLVGNRISQQALEHARHLREVHSKRVETVRRIWGGALDQLDILRHLVWEWNCDAIGYRQGAYANPNTSFALDRLVVRAHEVVGEIIALARAGYADGALARWRSLHEVGVIAMFLARRSDSCAQMYLAHHKVEELRLLEVDKASGTARVRDIHNDRRIRDLRAQKAAMVNTFGKAFASDYGWASVYLNRTKTTFRDIEAHVGLETLRRGYQRANSIVHGGALATLTRISLGPESIDGTDVPPAYGCEVAITYVTASLSMMVAELCLDAESADLLAMSMVVHNCANEIRERIEETRKNVSGDSLRARLLARKALQHRHRVKQRRTFQKRR